jgi:hypothetical protein
MQFPGGPRNVLSGLMAGAGEVKDRAAVMALPVGAGQIILFTTNPMYRWQNFGEYRMLYNTLFNYKNLQLGIDIGNPKVEFVDDSSE